MFSYRRSVLLLLAVGSCPTADAFAPSTTKHERISTAFTIPDDMAEVGSLTVPQIGCGTIAWSSDEGQPNSELAELITAAYKRNGGGFFDTGERYGSHSKTALGMGWGETESLVSRLIGEADLNVATDINHSAAALISNAPKPVVATKFTPSPWRTSVNSVVEACEQSRQRLGVESIDLYQIQMPDIVKPLRFFGFDKSYDEVYWDGLAECYHRGLVKNVGVSNYGPTLVTKCQEHLSKRGVPLASNQIAYSLIGRHNGAQETVDRCNQLGVKVLAYYPFAMGLLTGKYTSKFPELSAEDALASSLSNSKRSQFEQKDLQRYANGGNNIPSGGVAPLLCIMERIAKLRGATVAQVALNYIICKGAIPIPGARTADQYADNMGAMHWRLTQEEVSQMESAADDLGFSFDGAGFKRSDAKFVGYGMERWSLS